MCYGSGCRYEITGGNPDFIGECKKPRGRQCPMDDEYDEDKDEPVEPEWDEGMNR